MLYAYKPFRIRTGVLPPCRRPRFHILTARLGFPDLAGFDTDIPVRQPAWLRASRRIFFFCERPSGTFRRLISVARHKRKLSPVYHPLPPQPTRQFGIMKRCEPVSLERYVRFSQAAVAREMPIHASFRPSLGYDGRFPRSPSRFPVPFLFFIDFHGRIRLFGMYKTTAAVRRPQLPPASPLVRDSHVFLGRFAKVRRTRHDIP